MADYYGKNITLLFPSFNVEIVCPESLTGTINTVYFKNEKWIEDNYLGYLVNENSWAYGRWKKENDKWQFFIELQSNQNINYVPQMTLNAVDGYWGERVTLVLDKNTEWQLKTLDIKIDHEHCAICCTTIFSEAKYYEAKTVLNNIEYKSLVCLDCYKNHIKLCNVNFIP